jgi:hypothetical protein
MSISRRRFVQLSAGTLAGYMIGLQGCKSGRLRVSGHVYDQYGFPVQGASISYVTGYALKPDDGLSITQELAGPVLSDTLGQFDISMVNPSSDVAFRVTVNNQLQRIVAKQVTGATIPFFDTEIFSPDSSKTINDIRDAGILNSVTIYIDTSRTHMWNYFQRNHAELVTLLENNQADDGESPWEGDHRSPDDPSTCDDCDDHYDFPRFERERKVNPPWGSQRGVIPFVCAEGIMYKESINEPDGDGDRDFDMMLEPQYFHLPNNNNQSDDLPPPPRNKESAMHVEMCNIFMGKKGAGVSLTSLSRDADDEDLNRLLNNNRVWLTGTWTVEGDHDHWNEIHPIYWVVPFIGGWRRFVASEIIRVGLTNSGAKSIIADQLATDPASLIETLSATFKFAIAFKSKEDAQKFYTASIVHLNKFGLNNAFPAGDSGVNSINEADFQQEASTLSIDEMTSRVTLRYNLIFNHLNTLGCGAFIFPAMLFINEGCDIFQHAETFGLNRPSPLTLNSGERVQVSLGKEVLAFDDLVVDNGLTPLQDAYADIFNQLKSNERISADAIANYYADVSIRLISYGMYDENNPQHSKNRADHFNWALPRAKSDTQALINSINVRIKDLWTDAFPFSRKT